MTGNGQVISDVSPMVVIVTIFTIVAAVPLKDCINYWTGWDSDTGY
jgi:membrane protein DedA with SNARE-associated domain